MIKPEIIELLSTQSEFFNSSWHGFDHWKRVERNGLYLARFNEADKAVISYFAYFHDCMRENEGIDDGHGLRGAEFALKHRDIIDLNDAQFEKLLEACKLHTAASATDCIIINTCRDADRLDLWRVGTKPLSKYLFNEEAKRIADSTDSQAEIDDWMVT